MLTVKFAGTARSPEFQEARSGDYEFIRRCDLGVIARRHAKRGARKPKGTVSMPKNWLIVRLRGWNSSS